MQYYLCFKVNKIPDLTLAKYSVFDISGQTDLIDKHRIFLRQLHRLGVESNVFFHLLYYYDGSENVSKGKRIQIIFYATSESPRKLEYIREFVTTSVLSNYYDFYCYEISSSQEYTISEGRLQFANLSNTKRNYKISDSIRLEDYDSIRRQIEEDGYLYCTVQPGTNEVTEINSQDFFLDDIGRIGCDYTFDHGAFLTKKDYHLYAQNRLYNDPPNTLIPIYSIMDWIPNPLGRLYNVLKLMEGYNETAAIRIDIFPADIAESFSDNMAGTISDLRQRLTQHDQGRDDNCDAVLKSIDSISKKLMKFPQFFANIVAFSDYKDIAVMLADSIGAEAVESGSYLVNDLNTFSDNQAGYDIYSHDGELLINRNTHGQDGNYMSDYVSLYTLDEVRPMFSFPVLYPGEAIECMKETDPEFEQGNKDSLYLGESENGYSVNFPVSLLKKHAFVAGVPGSGKTNTLLYMASELWISFNVPFLILEPAKQEYRALLKASQLPGLEKLKEVCIFSPGADTKFPLHINPFEFPKGLTLAEHIANLNAVFAGAFELPPPSPHFIDTCIEQVYVNKGWNINSRNDGSLPYPTMQELFDSLNVAVQNSYYDGETLGNLRSILEVRIGSLLKRETGNVYNVEKSSLSPEEWIERPVIIELEALGEGPANFMALLISTLIRETLKIRKLQKKDPEDQRYPNTTGVNHIIFYEEAHNLIGPTQESVGDQVDPKVSATKFLVKMLAEVRALNEGIVIADQLPSAMASEVLKNTGLKIGHRITANDDRDLLGSTMSASADQLAEQSIYTPGEALIFYEGLRKPFTMQVAKWHLYDSPTDSELVDIMKDYPVYQELISRSGEIVLSRVLKSFDKIYSRIDELNEKNIVPAYDVGREWVDHIQKRKQSYVVDKDKVKVLADIKEMEGQFTNPNSKFSEYSTVAGAKKMSIHSKVEEILKESNILFFNNISVVGNYGNRAPEMSARIIEAYFHVFECFKWNSLWGDEIIKTILDTTLAARQEIEEFVSLTTPEPTGLLKDFEFFKTLKEESFAIKIFELIDEFNVIHKKLLSLIDWKNQKIDTSMIEIVSEEYTKLYFDWMKIAEQYEEHRSILQTEVILKYCEIFDVFNLLHDIGEVSSCILSSVQLVKLDVSKHVSWGKEPGNGDFSGFEDYDQLVKCCRNFTRTEINALYYIKAKLVLKRVLSEVNNVFMQVDHTQVTEVCRAYQAAFVDSYKICAEIGDRELLADTLDLFYLLITSFGSKLSDSGKKYFNTCIENIWNVSLALRPKTAPIPARRLWGIVDLYWNR